MKILFVINSLGAGGAERSLAELLATKPSHLTPTVACLKRASEGVQDSSMRNGVDLRLVQGGTLVAQTRGLRKLITDLRPDIVHTTLFEADLAGRSAAHRTGVPVLTSLVNTPYEPVRLQDPEIRSWKLRAVQAIDGWTARHLTAHFHAITHAVKAAAVRDLRIDPCRVTVIERGRDPKRLGAPSLSRCAQARRTLGFAEAPFLIVSVGRQEFQKGQEYLLEAIPEITAKVPHATTLIAGRRGNASGRLVELARRHSLDGRVRFLGHRDDLPEVLAAADLFAFPSLYEGLGGALLEAMALGLPIVASDLPAIREVVQDGTNAILVPPGSPRALASAVTRLAGDPTLCRRMGARSREIFLERFTLEHSAARMVELFEQIASEGRRPR